MWKYNWRTKKELLYITKQKTVFSVILTGPNLIIFALTQKCRRTIGSNLHPEFKSDASEIYLCRPDFYKLLFNLQGEIL